MSPEMREKMAVQDRRRATAKKDEFIWDDLEDTDGGETDETGDDVGNEGMTSDEHESGDGDDDCDCNEEPAHINIQDESVPCVLNNDDPFAKIYPVVVVERGSDPIVEWDENDKM